MKHLIYIAFFCSITIGFSQQTVTEKFKVTSQEIEISTAGLDTITIINSDSDSIEVSLFNEEINSNYIIIDDEEGNLKIRFEVPFLETNTGVFRKFITKRLHRAYGTLKIPQHKTVTIIGKNIDVISKDYQGDLNIFIDKGYLNFNTVSGNVDARLLRGTVLAEIVNSNIKIKTNTGVITINNEEKGSPFSDIKKNDYYNFSVNSINANVVLNKIDKP